MDENRHDLLPLPQCRMGFRTMGVFRCLLQGKGHTNPCHVVCKRAQILDLQGVFSTMSRKRSSDPAKPCTFSMPTSVHTRLNNHLSFEMSRSAWITSAIQAKLEGESSNNSLEHWTTDELLQEMLYSRFKDDQNNADAIKEMIRTIRLLL